jgi:pimeloyl-ACP methyl ester carboxylesterase
MRSPHRPIRELAVPVAPGRALGVAEFGDPNGFPVIWSHGTPGGRLQLPPNAPARAAALGIRLFGVERPGTGRSTPHHYDCVRDYAADIDAMTRNLGFDRFGVIGLSGGGPYTLACAHDLPDRVVAAAVIGGMAPLAGPDAASGPLQKLAPFAAPILDRVSATVGRNLPRILHPFIPHAAAAVRAFAAIAP